VVELLNNELLEIKKLNFVVRFPFCTGRCSQFTNFSFIQQEYVESSSYTYVTADYESVGFEVLTVVTMKSSVFCDTVPCNLVKVNMSELLLHYKV
jgi:hypothetical protein